MYRKPLPYPPQMRNTDHLPSSPGVLAAIFLKKFDEIIDRLDGMQTKIAAVQDKFTPLLAILDDDENNDENDNDDNDKYDDNNNYNDYEEYDNDDDYNDYDEYDDNDDYNDYDEYDDDDDYNDDDDEYNEDDDYVARRIGAYAAPFFARVDAVMVEI